MTETAQSVRSTEKLASAVVSLFADIASHKTTPWMQYVCVHVSSHFAKPSSLHSYTPTTFRNKCFQLELFLPVLF